jgi:hypothetical protein
MKIQRFDEHSRFDEMSWDFINGFDSLIKESDNDSYTKIEKKTLSDLKLNIGLVGTFGTGIKALYPIVEGMLTNMGSIEITKETVVLSTICALTIIYLEEHKLSGEEEDELTKDSKSMLEELRMLGVGNGIIKKIIKAFKSIMNIFNSIGKHLGAVVGGFMDMFAYTTLLIPIMNGIAFIIDKYNFTPDTIIQNFFGLAVGVGTIIAKHGLSEVINKIKGKFPLNKKKIISEIETPIIQKVGDLTDDNQDGDLIKEQ